MSPECSAPISEAAVSSQLRAGGDAGRILASRNWQAHPLGPLSGWPQSLRTALSICLSSRYPICILWGPERTYFYNDAYAPIVGAKHPRALGDSYPRVWPEIWDSDIRPILEAVEATGEASWSEDLLLVLERHGFPEECYFGFSFAPIRDETGGVGGVFTAITETTSRVVGERRLRTLRDLGDRVSEAGTVISACRAAVAVLAENRHDAPFGLIYLLDEQGKAVELGASFGVDEAQPCAPARIELGGALEQVTWPLSEVLASGRAVRVANLGNRFGRLSGGPWPEPSETAWVLPLAKAAAEPAGFLILGASPRRPVDDGYRGFSELVAGGVAGGIANARAHEQERKRVRALAELDRAKSAFFSKVSHEFRTPLTLMLGPLEEALQKGELRQPELELTYRNVLRLLKLVNTLLDFSRAEAGRLQAAYEPSDVAELTRDLCGVFRSAFERAGLELVVDCPPLSEAVYVDRVMLEQVLSNLLSNALKFTFEGRVEVRLGELQEHVELCVADTGVGIASEQLPRIFERFHRVEGSRARTHEGSGIGLSLVSELVRLHGGEIEAESTLGVGTRFVIRLPKGHAHLPSERIRARGVSSPRIGVADAFVSEALRWLPAAGEPAAKSEAPRSGRVLIVDDNADLREYLTRILRREFRVELAADGRLALEAARRDVPDLILTDVMMPNLDGCGLLAELRADPRTRAVPVIMLSARAGEEARVEGLASGADDYLVKPFSAKELVARVRTHLELGRLRRAADEERRKLNEALAAAEAARAQAESAARAKDEFLAMLSHELRNPLAPIITALELMRVNGVTGGEHERSVIERQVRHVVGLVDDLLDVARITRGRLELKHERVEFSDVVARAIEMASPLIEQRRHSLSVSAPPELVVRGDYSRLAQVMANLITNSAKYTETGGHIAIVAAAEADELVARVSDDGIGIAEDMLPRVFDLFTQERQQLARSRGGLGLGLAIVKSLVEAHGGSVRIHSPGLGRGTEVEVRLPLDDGQGSSSRAEPLATRVFAAAPQLRIMIVDDNVDAVELLRAVLEAAGHAVRTANDGAEALRLASDFVPNVAFVDLGLPVLDGFEVVRRLRQQPHWSHVRIVALTGYGRSSDYERTRQAGFDGHLVKPVDLARLEHFLCAGPEPA